MTLPVASKGLDLGLILTSFEMKRRLGGDGGIQGMIAKCVKRLGVGRSGMLPGAVAHRWKTLAGC